LFGLKRVSAALCLFLITAAAASAQTSAGARSPDLIEVTAGVIDGSSVRTMNPAALFFLPESRLSVGLDYRDRLSLETDYSLGLESYVSQPSLSYNLNYSGGGWSLTAYSDYCFEKRGIVGEALMLDVLRTNGIEFGASYGIGSPALRVGAHLPFIDGDERQCPVGDHRLCRAKEIARRWRHDPFLAGNQRDLWSALQLYDPIIDFARQKAQRKADHAASMSTHPLNREMGFAGVGGAEHGGEMRPECHAVIRPGA